MGVKWDWCSEDHNLCKERDSKYERFEINIWSEGCLNGEWVEDQLDNPVSLDVTVTPSNILRYNQAYKFIRSRFQVYARILTRSLSNTESRCSSRIQVDCKTSKEQAKVYY